MTCRSARSQLPSITARPSPDEKERFATLARARGLSESALVLSAIRAVIVTDSGSLDPYATSAQTPATDRITIRLRPGDGEAIARRASQRGMKPSAYLAALVRAHVAVNPPLPANELVALKQSIVLLAGLGRLLAQTARNPLLAGTGLKDLRHNLSRTRAAIAALEQRVAGIDQVLGTRDVVRITGRHRCTIYRWVRAGTFPAKRAGGGRGWLRSDVEHWLQGSGSGSEWAPPLPKTPKMSGT